MTNPLDQTFSRLKRSKKKALIGYVTAGFPQKKSFLKLIPQLEQAGLDLLEIGVPFSDPIADGATIQQASEETLRQGVTLAWILQAVRLLRRRVRIPIILMSYANPLLAMGLDSFFGRARNVGVDGLIVPDLIPEEAALFERSARRSHVDLIYLVAPTTPKDRLATIARATRGFLYAVSLTGVTGARSTLPADTREFLRRLRPFTRKPIALGFGIARPQQVRSIRQEVDGVIVGSALIRAIAASRNGSFHSAVQFVQALQKALNPNKERI